MGEYTFIPKRPEPNEGDDPEATKAVPGAAAMPHQAPPPRSPPSRSPSARAAAIQPLPIAEARVPNTEAKPPSRTAELPIMAPEVPIGEHELLTGSSIKPLPLDALKPLNQPPTPAPAAMKPRASAPPRIKSASRPASVLSDTEIGGFLQSLPALRALSTEAQEAIIGVTVARKYPAKAIVVRASSPASNLGIIYRGTIGVEDVDATLGSSKASGDLSTGDFFSEVGVLIGGSSGQLLTAKTDVVALELTAADALRLGRQYPDFLLALARRTASKVAQLGLQSMTAAAAPAVIAASNVEAAPATPGGMHFVQVSEYEPGPDVLRTLPVGLIRQHRMLPLALRQSVLTVGMVSPHDASARAQLKKAVQTADLRVVAISIDDFSSALVRLKLPSTSSSKNSSGPRGAIHINYDAEDAEREEKDLRVVGDEVVRLLDRVFATAFERDASDIHIEPERSQVGVRFRIGSSLEQWPEMVPPSFARGIAARIKVLAGLDLTERRRPQDGRIGLTYNRQELDLRVSLIPAVRGEKIVVRVARASSVLRPLEHVFLDVRLLETVRTKLMGTTGAVVVAGSTGSGKTSTMYSMLQERRKLRLDSNVLMVEDPIEFRMAGVTQVQVNPAVGLTFPVVLRATLRQDPDVVVVGETRDDETARLAMEASISGHLVLTSLHANDAATAIQRLESLGTGRALVTQGLSLVVVQRLAPRLCTQCARLESPPRLLLDGLKKNGITPTENKLPFPGGCGHCEGTGYDGRLAVAEILELDSDVRLALGTNLPLTEVVALARQAGRFTSFAESAALLMQRRLLGAADALLTVSA